MFSEKNPSNENQKDTESDEGWWHSLLVEEKQAIQRKVEANHPTKLQE